MSRSQIGADLSGRKITLTGQIASVTERSTKEQKPYLIVNMALLDGDIDVFVWENIMVHTEGLWKAGALLEVLGTVRAREDRVSISCISATEYSVAADGQAESDSASDGQATSAAAPEPPRTASGPGLGGPPPRQSPVPSASPPGTPVTQAPSNGAHAPRRLTLRIQETDQPGQDRRVLDDISRLLLGHQGSDEVSLEIASEGRVYTMSWPLVKVAITEELRDDLQRTLGSAGSLRIEEAVG
jgi:hypothetical protein